MMGKHHGYDRDGYDRDHSMMEQMKSGGEFHKKMDDDHDEQMSVRVVAPFYEALSATDKSETEVAQILGSVLDSEWTTNDEAVSATAFASNLKNGFHALIPDLSWEIEDTWASDDVVVVRGKASGTPNGDFFGVSTNGTRSFEIMSIDIHEIDDGMIEETYHIEDWSSAIAQVSE